MDGRLLHGGIKIVGGVAYATYFPEDPVLLTVLLQAIPGRDRGHDYGMAGRGQRREEVQVVIAMSFVMRNKRQKADD